MTAPPKLGTFTPRSAAVTNEGDTALRAQLREIIYGYESSRPRSRQVRIGPSEIGEACARKLAYKIAGMPEPEGAGMDPWYSIIGTAVHAWLAESLEHHNATAPQRGESPRWLVEQRVTVREGLDGTMDAFDLHTGTVLDHKVVGKTAHDKYRRHGPSEVYRGQAHAYGLGAWLAGLEVRKVAIAFYPRTQDLRGLYVWSEPFDSDVALRALERLDRVNDVVRMLNPMRDPEQFARIPKTPSEDCRFCPFLEPGPDTGFRCPGNTEKI